MPFVSGLYTFQSSNFKHAYSIKYKYALSSVIYLLNGKKCNKSDVGSNINAFRTRYYNHSSNLNRNGIGQRSMDALIAITNLKKNIFILIYDDFVEKEL